MYHRLGENVSHHPWWIVAVWVALLTSLLLWAPAPQQISKDGVLAFLPPDSPSRKAERVFREAFPNEGRDSSEVTGSQQDPLGSNIVIVVRREDQPNGLTEADRKFVDEVLTPRLEEIRMTTPEGRRLDPGMTFAQLPPEQRRVRSIWTWRNDRTGPLLDSDDGHSTLIVMELNGEFLDYGNFLVIKRVENLLKSVAESKQTIPPGLDLAISGSATVGRDMLLAEQQSASNTDLATKALVIVLLLLIYRAPIVAMIPLMTVGVSVVVAIRLLALMAKLGWIGFFAGMNVYVLVVAYGAGVDYCLFLIARFREQLSHGTGYGESISKAVGHVGVALTASAGASICGILMMMSAEFLKFRQAGFAISFGLFVVLICSLTLTPALLRILAKWAFWPDVRKEHIQAGDGWIPSPGIMEKLRERRWFDQGWEWVARLIEARPGTVLLTSIALMMPFVAVGVAFHDHLSYGLLTDLPQNDASVVGARAIQKHFPAGIAGVTTVLLQNEEFADPSKDPAFADEEADVAAPPAAAAVSPMSMGMVSYHESLADQIATALRSHGNFPELGIVDIRSQRMPLGEKKHSHILNLPVGQKRAARNIAHKAFSSTSGPLAGKVIRFDIVFDEDPFSRNSIEQLSTAEAAVRDSIPESLRAKTEVYTLGPTAGIRDLKSVTDRDQVRIDVLVCLAVLAVLIMLLRQVAVSIYLIVTVVFSYLVTIGVTYCVFWLRDPANFAGLDWKVPIFTFTLLIALGEDYNILLMARVVEEQRKHGMIKGILVALTKTGGIISSCGIIMAGTFCSLLTGTLMGMVQLGFALAFGVLLDTFVVRPVLVPAYLVMLYGGRFGRLGPILGATKTPPEDTAFLHAIAEADDDDGENGTGNPQPPRP